MRAREGVENQRVLYDYYQGSDDDDSTNCAACGEAFVHGALFYHEKLPKPLFAGRYLCVACHEDYINSMQEDR